MKFLSFAIVLLITSCAIAQRTIPATDTLIVMGKVAKPALFTIAELDTFPKTKIKDQIIYNHKGEIKDTLTGLKGFSLKTLLAPIKYSYDKPKELNEFYFVFIASDGYKVVFSWNEIYNTEIGNQFYIITEMKGKKIKDLDQRILFMSTADLNTGRRYIKGLKKIEVKRVE